MLWVRFPAMPDAQNIDIVVLDFVANFVSINQQTADFARVKAKQLFTNTRMFQQHLRRAHQFLHDLLSHQVSCNRPCNTIYYKHT